MAEDLKNKPVGNQDANKTNNSKEVIHGRSYAYDENSYGTGSTEEEAATVNSQQQATKEFLSKFTTAPSEFKGANSQNLFTSKQLGDLVNMTFGPIFSDYYGARVFPNVKNPAQVLCEMSFSPGVNTGAVGNRIPAFEPTTLKGETGEKGMRALIKNWDQLTNTSYKKFSLTAAAREAFMGLVDPRYYTKKLDPKTKKQGVNWNQLVREYSINNRYSGEAQLMYSFQVLIGNFCQIFWGDKNKEGHPVRYLITLNNNMFAQTYASYNAYLPPEAQNWVFEVTQIDVLAQNQILSTLGYADSQDGYVVYNHQS